MSLTRTEHDPWVAPLAITEAAPVRSAAETSAGLPARLLFSADVAVAFGLRESPQEQAGGTPLPEVRPKSSERDLFDPGLRTEFDALPSASPKEQTLPKGGMDGSEAGHGSRGQTDEGAVGGGGSLRSDSALASDPAPLTSAASNGSIQNLPSTMGSLLASATKMGSVAKQLSAGAVSLPPSPTVPAGPGNRLPDNNGNSGGGVDPRWGRNDTPPPLPT